jgi:hypothetical protein
MREMLTPHENPQQPHSCATYRRLSWQHRIVGKKVLYGMQIGYGCECVTYNHVTTQLIHHTIASHCHAILAFALKSCLPPCNSSLSKYAHSDWQTTRTGS